MNFLDILTIIVMAIILLFGIMALIYGFAEDDAPFGCICFGIAAVIFGALLPIFIVIDRSSGSTIGVITSVDKNFFGTTAVYVKTSETTQEKYCVEDDDVAEKAMQLIGKEVKVEYGTRVGIYSITKCNEAPIDKIIEMKSE